MLYDIAISRYSLLAAIIFGQFFFVTAVCIDSGVLKVILSITSGTILTVIIMYLEHRIRAVELGYTAIPSSGGGDTS